MIAALKLTRGAGLQDVHPITLRYDGLETCFPLRLSSTRPTTASNPMLEADADRLADIEDLCIDQPATDKGFGGAGACSRGSRASPVRTCVTVAPSGRGLGETEEFWTDRTPLGTIS